MELHHHAKTTRVIPRRALIANTAICGSPEQVIDRMGHIRETLHLDTQILMFDMGGMPDNDLFQAIELLGTEVIPAVSTL
jgi:alkanesulfonate monooxygenase SsuD/methylene tetrahydromethanopterin reductase-like flavin-dependent oxidoreductase (luciferase family)